MVRFLEENDCPKYDHFQPTQSKKSDRSEEQKEYANGEGYGKGRERYGKNNTKDKPKASRRSKGESVETKVSVP